MSRLAPFFSYFGSKWCKAGKYPEPKYDMIVEPFAGSAGYSTLYYDKKIVLIEKYFRVYRVWKYLIEANKNDILSLPLLNRGEKIDNIKTLSDAEKDFIGFWLNKNCIKPKKSLVKSAIAESNANVCGFWSELTRKKIANQVNKINHWEVYCNDYSVVEPPMKVTWFIYPPYINNKYYICNLTNMDYKRLAEWCKTRSGQVIVCEGPGVDWLDFKNIYINHGSGNKFKKSIERIWINDN
jgi:hypothetical protein